MKKLKPKFFFLLFLAALSGCVVSYDDVSREEPHYKNLGMVFKNKVEVIAVAATDNYLGNPKVVDYVYVVPLPGWKNRYVVDSKIVPKGTAFKVVGAVKNRWSPTHATYYVVEYDGQGLCKKCPVYVSANGNLEVNAGLDTEFEVERYKKFCVE